MSRRQFADRRDAGRRLAHDVGRLLLAHPELDDPVILALPRGGVPVAFEIARRLGAPLDLVMVRKIGVPWQPELAAAAIVNGDANELVLNEDVIAASGMSEAALEAARRRELAEIARRRERYLAGRAPVAVEGRDAIVVDDGVATGATTRAALRGVRRRRPRSLTLAVPVAPRDTLARLAREVDHLVCLASPEPFLAIGNHYDDFAQVRDEEVIALLGAAAGSGQAGAIR